MSARSFVDHLFILTKANPPTVPGRVESTTVECVRDAANSAGREGFHCDVPLKPIQSKQISKLRAHYIVIHL